MNNQVSELSESPTNLAKMRVGEYQTPGVVADEWERFVNSSGMRKMETAKKFVNILSKFLHYMMDIVNGKYEEQSVLEWMYENCDLIKEDFIAYNHAVSGIGDHSQYLIDNFKEFKTAPWKQINTQILYRQIKVMKLESLQTIQSIFK